MKSLKNYYLIVFVLLLMSSCDKDEPFVPPVIKVNSATDVTNTTAVINAEITESGSEPILKYGFVWAEGYDDISTLDDGTIQYLEGSPNEGIISFELKNLEQGKEYSYNAFIQTETDTYMNKYDMSFTMAQPEITDINPKEGAGGTKVTITGKYFTANKDAISLELGLYEAEILEASETEITFIAPDGYEGDKDIELSLVVNGVQSQSEITFKYFDYFTLPVKYLRSGKCLTVFISPMMLPVKENGDDLVPDIYVEINGELCEYYNYSTIGTGFATGYDIYVTAPENLQPGEATIKVYNGSGYQFFDKGNSLTILPSGVWAKKQDLPNSNLGKGIGFSKDELGYVLNKKKLYQYKPNSNSWVLYKEILSLQDKEIDAVGVIDEELLILQGKTLKTFNFLGDYSQARADFPGVERNGAISFVVNNTFYYGLGYVSEDYQNDLWKYNLDTDEWIRLSDCPSRNFKHSRIVESVFVRGNNVFISGLVYDYATDTYMENNEPIYYGNYGFDINNKYYEVGWSVVFPKEDEKNEDVFKKGYKDVFCIKDYDFTIEEMVEDVHCPINFSAYFFTFNLNDKIYIGTDNEALEFWEYTPAQ
nr:IPT/TIG domain-containing protein [uncultured Marinifilum sp.]